MRESKITYKTQTNGFKNKTRLLIKAAVFVVLFSLLFSGVLLSVCNVDFADAAYSRAVTTVDVSSLSSSGTDLITSSSNNNSTWNARFGIAGDVSNSTDAFGWNSSEYGGWGYTDMENAGDKGIVYWLEFKFSSTALAAVKAGRVSFYATAHSTFEDGNDDATSMGISFGTVHSNPTADFISGSSSKRTDSWSTTGKNNLAYYERDRFYGWDGGTFNFSASRHDFSFGSNKGAYDANYRIPTNATSIRLVFAVVGNGNIDGGYSNIHLRLFEQPDDTLASTDSSYDLSKTLYGDQYKIENNSANNFGTLYTYKKREDASSYYTRIAKTDYNLSNSNTIHSDGDYKHTWTNKPSSGAGVLFALGRDNCEYYVTLLLTLTIPAATTSVTVSGNINTCGYSSKTVDSGEQIYVEGYTQLWTGTKTVSTTSATMISGTPSATSVTGKTTIVKADGTSEKSLTKTPFSITADGISSSTTTMTLAFRVHMYKDDVSGWGDYGQLYAVLGDLKVSHKGTYNVAYDKGDTSASGTMSNQTFTYGIKDSTETLRKNTFTNGSDTFVGWATVKGGSVAYKEDYTYSGSIVTTSTFDTSHGATGSAGAHYTNWTNELTKVPGATVTLYAVWVDSDFGIVDGKSRDETWGSESNPYIIENKVHWNNLIDIVNGSREPVDSVKGNHYGKVINTAASYTSFSGNYFALTNNLNLGETAPVGADIVTAASTAKNFKGTLYGANATYNSSGTLTSLDGKALKTLTVSINVGEGNAGLFNYLNGATVEYIGVAGQVLNFTGSNYAGGIVGLIGGTTSIKNCSSSANVILATFDSANNATAKNGAGGLIGYVQSGANVTVENCRYAGGSNYVVKNVDGNTVIDANVFGANGVGGIIGHMPNETAMSLKLSGCSASGDICGTQNIGGIIGRADTSTAAVSALLLNNLYSSATVKATGTTSTAGGIIGYLHYSGGATTNNVVKLQYAYNCGTVQASGNNAGGIVGSAEGANSANIKIAYCYNTGSVSGNSAVGVINGKGTCTVEDSWGLYSQNSATADFNAFPAGGGGNKAIIAVSSSFSAAYYTRPSDGNNNTGYEWTDITDTSVAFTKFAVFSSSYTVTNGQYIILRDAVRNAIVTPDATDNRETTPTSSSTNLYGQHMVFNAALKNRSNQSVTNFAIEKETVKLPSSLEKFIIYGNTAPTDYSWITIGTADSNRYVTGLKVKYYNGAWADSETVKDVYYSNGSVLAYKVKFLLYNGDHLVGVSVPDTASYTINQRQLTVTSSWRNNLKADSYIYNAEAQGLYTVSITGFAADETVDNQLTLTGLSRTVNEGAVANVNHTALITLDETVNVGEYSFAFTRKNNNYKFKVDSQSIDIAQTTVSFSWKITKKSISNPTVFDADAYDIWFGYGPNGVASGAYTYLIGADSIFALDMRRLGVFYAEADAPYALIYRDNKDIYTDIFNYKLYIKTTGGYQGLDKDTDYSVSINGGAISGDKINFNGGSILQVTMTYTGVGNYDGTRVIRFTLMDSDFGGNVSSPDYGSSGNPYLIENTAHLIRLGQIAAGSPAWNSINSTDKTVAYAANSNAVAVSRDYSSGYFYLTDNISVSTKAGFISIGKNASDYFSGTFSGSFGGTNYTVTLDVNETDRSEDAYGLAISDYTGLFGYLKNAKIITVSTEGTVNGRDRVGGIAGYADTDTVFEGVIRNNASVNGRNFVGGIIGELAGSIANAVNSTDAVISGARAVGGIAGGVASVNKTAISNCENRGKVKYNAAEDGGQISGFSVIDRGRALPVNGIGGIIGFVGAKGVRIIDCRNYERASEYIVDGSGATGVGGIIGFASVSDGTVTVEATVEAGTENRGYVRGAYFVGGIVGYAENVMIEANCRVNSNVTGEIEYTGGIAGKWIVNDASQMPGQRRVQSNVYIVGDSYVGGLVGWLDARNTKGFNVTPFITNGTANPIRVTGTSYVGALYGGVEGYGYKRTSQSVSPDDSVIYVNPSTTGESIYVRVNLKAGGHVAGGLIGYASGVGILFLGDWTGLDHTPVTFLGATSFFGGVIGVLGENASIESAMNSAGGISVGGVTHTVRFRSVQSASDINVGGDFVGSVAGYVASSAGAYLSADTTIMGNGVKLFNNSQILGRSFVGGVFGALGKVASEHYTVTNGVNENIFKDAYLINLIRYGKYGGEATGPNTTLRYAPSDDGGLGKMFNYSPIVGTGNFVGGIVGYAGSNSLLAFQNPVVTGSEANFSLNDAASFLNVYNGYGNNPTDGDTATIKGANYVGGIAGYISSSAHEMTRVVSLMIIKANSNGNESNFEYDGSYAGGLFGYMGGGAILSSIATSGYSNPSQTVNAYMGKEYVGGIVGMLASGSINMSLSRGFRFDSVSMTRGGIAGSVNAGTTITSSWTFYLADNPSYATVSQNTNGKHVIVNSTVAKNYSPRFSEYGRMIGLFADSVGIIERASNSVYNKAKEGYLSLSTSLPAKNNQLVFYDASGNDIKTPNQFETLSGANSVVYYRFDMANTDSFSICVRPIAFENISANPTGEAQQKQFVHDAYVKPSANDFYDVDVQSVMYSGGYIQYAQGIAICKGNNNPNDANNIVVLGNFEKYFEIGDAETPYIISNPTEWNTFATNIRNNRTVGSVPINGYLGKYIKLATDDIVVTLNNLAGDRTSNYNVFKGTFDGDGHKIKIQVENSNASLLTGVSVFPNAMGATFKNLTIEGDIKATGDAINSTEAENIAGFVGKPLGNLTFENCTNLTNITANRTAGGLVGFSNNYTMTFVSCVNGRRGAELGRIECNDADIAGYAEYSYGTGGIIGYSNNAITIESCKNEGNIRGAYNVGGIIGRANKGTTIYNCANNGEIFADAHWVDEADYAGRKDTEAYRKVYVGGIIGQVGEEGWLKMYASYNSGKIIGFGPIVGGLAGSVGSLILATSTSSDTGKAGAKSTIAYCYNTGEVYSSGTNTSYNHRSSGWSGGREEFNGSVVGGIVGFMAWGDINYCYNTGKISTFRIIGYAMSWQARIGGIAGQVQPSASGYATSFNYCYNLGELFVSAKTENIVGVSSTRIYWGGGICGYLDKNTDTGKLSSSNCYTIANYLHTYCSSSDQSWGSASINSVDSGDEKRYVIGTVVDSVDKLTAYMSESGKTKVDRSIGTAAAIEDYYQASTLITSEEKSVATYSGGKMTYDSLFLSGTAYGYIYPYGCLPQLAVFALDTKEGLSMLSVSFGRNEYDKFVGNQAGSKESPYVIKDGVGLLAMSALNGAKSNTGSGTGYYSFRDKYVEFADGTNNIESMTASYINMDMSTSSYSFKSNSTGSTVYSQSGKNYFLYSLGAASGNTTVRYGSSPATASSLRTNWYNKNYYFNGTSMTYGASYNTYVNFYPIGSVSVPFTGHISGAQGESGNTEIRNLKVSVRSAGNSFAGLFGTVYDAALSRITVAGKVSAFTSDNLSGRRSFAGGIVGYAGGNTLIEACQAGAESYMLTVNAYANQTSQSSSNVAGYAGGIVGVVGPGKPISRTQDLKTSELRENRVSYANIYTVRKNAGGIAGYVGNPWKASDASSGRGNYVNIYNSYVYGVTVAALSSSDVADTGEDIGGLVGANDGDVLFTVSGAYIGQQHPDSSAPTSGKVNIYGENSVGGVVGTLYGNSAIGNVNVTDNVNIERRGYGAVKNVNEGLYRTAIGGVIGRTQTNTVNTLRDSIVYNGGIKVDVENTNPSDNNPTGNIGGVIGAMGEGTRFLSGSIVTVTGSISSSLSGLFLRNFGGVVGATIDGAFDGTFNVSPRISADNATNVGGFIGRNFGTANILSSTTGTVIKIEANITGKSQVGGLVGLNGYTYSDGVVAGSLLIGADTYLGTRYEGTVDIEISPNARIKALENDAGGLIGSNIANGAGLGLIITKGSIYNKGTVSGLNNVGGIIGNNAGDITMGGSTLQDVIPKLVNEGNVTGGTVGSGGYIDDGNGRNIGGVIGYLQKGSIAGTFANTGSVVGGYFVGGTVGRLDKDAILTVSGTNNTYFYNGLNDLKGAEVAATSDSTVGNVTGKMYVGGSIGALFGTVRGLNNYVVFVNDGVVNGDTFTGGNIGLLAGGVDGAQFVNRGRVLASGAVAIGGSVGFIGVSKLYDTENYEHQPISVARTHFEFAANLADGDNNSIVVSGNAPAGKGEFEWGGVGGSIGIIGDSTNDFDNVNGLLWQDITLYAEGSIRAANINNVGGAIGLIKANNIVISNMLAFYTSVTGKKNIGGIVGAVTGRNIQINNSFNIEGTVSGDTAGGIVGWVVKVGEGVTVADTSYWVKGYLNAQLMALDLASVVDDIGKYMAVSDGNNVFTEELTDAYGTPAHYTGNDADGNDWQAYLKKLCGRDVQVVNGVWAYAQNSEGYTTGEASTGWYYIYANDRRGLDATHISAADNSKPSVLTESERASELVYWKRIAGAYTAEELRPDENGVSEATKPLVSPIVGQVAGTTVSGNGSVAEGSIYAAALESKINGYYLYMDASGEKPSIYYSSSTIDWNDTGVQERPFYLTAKTSLDKSNPNDKNAQNVVVYYRSVGIGGTLVYNGYKRYVPITAEIGKSAASAQTQVIKYLSSDDMLSEGRSGDYVYTMTNVKKNGVVINQNEVCEAGIYTTDVSIYFYDTLGNYGKIGGIEQGTLRIEKMLLESSLTASNGTYKGDNTDGQIKLVLNGIAPLDDGKNMLSGVERSVKFNITGKIAGQIDGVLDIGALMKALGASGLGTKTFTADDRENANLLVNLTTNKIYMTSYTVALSNDMKNIDWDTDCIADDAFVQGVKTYTVTVEFGFTETISDTFIAELDSTGISASYSTNPIPLEVDFSIKPALLELKIADGVGFECEYDGAAHNTQYQFVGWVDKANENKSALINSLLPYVQYTSLAEESQKISIGGSDKPWEIMNSDSFVLSGTGNATYVTARWIHSITAINLSGMKDKGNYYVKFAAEPTYEVDGVKYMLTDGGNYYVKVPMDLPQNPTEQKPLYRITPNSFTVSWSTRNSATYNAGYYYLDATLTARYAFGSAELLMQEIETLFPEDYDADSFVIKRVDERNVIIKFRVGPNAGRHTVKLPGTGTLNCVITDPTDGYFTINKLRITVSFKGDKVVTYNGTNHQAETIEVGCAADENAKPKFSFTQSTGIYTISMFDGYAGLVNTADENKVLISLLYKNTETGRENQYAVNAGVYTAKVGTIKSAVTGVDNFDVVASADGSLTINRAKLTFAWAAQSSFTYNANPQGRGLTVSLSTSGLSQSGFNYNPNSATATAAELKLRNAYNAIETFTIPVTGNGQINARNTPYTASVNVADIKVAGQNRAGTTTLDNYEIIFNQATNGTYKINPLIIRVTGMSGANYTKTYDATVNVSNASIGTPIFDNTIKPATSSISITARYDSANVGNNRTITYTITITDLTDANNFSFDSTGATRTEYRHSGVIRARELTITLDMLRNMRAVKTYNGDAWYGGQSGASSVAGNSGAVSVIHRLGEGFSVSNIALAETDNGAVIIHAMFREALEDRSDFDAFVNNVVGVGAQLGIANTVYGDEDYFYKNLVFVLSGTSASNYSFKVVTSSNVDVGDKTGTEGSAGAVTVDGKTSGITIEIVPVTVRATYSNAAQSYATADNAYNTNWLDLIGRVTTVNGDILTVKMVNNWKYIDNNPANGMREYHSYTVIRGGENSNVLSARIDSATGVHVNYRLGNQPILTIGYFVDREEFEIASIAGLMIASYYYSASKNGGGEFGIISQAVWVPLATEEQYFDNLGYPTDNNGNPFLDADGNEISITCWDDYFAWLATEAGGNRDVFLNSSLEDSGWGYYSTESESTPKSFDRFKQIANISGVLTETDIAILNGMFKKTVISEDGTVNEEESYDWGVGAKYLPNFLKLGAGSVATAMGSVFADEFDGAYDGNGYVIDTLNIIGIATGGDNYVGMFARIAIPAQVKNVHLRNLNITVNGSGNAFVGGLAGESSQTLVENVSVHAAMTANIAGTLNIGGLFGTSNSAVDGAIVLGDINVSATVANAGGAIGKAVGSSVNNVVSLMQIWTKAPTAYVGGILGSASTAALGGVHAFMQNSVWVNKTQISGGSTYTELYNGSMSGYGVSKYYYTGDTENAKGTYDVLDDVKLTRMDGEEGSKVKPRESMRLSDIINVYVLMYSKTAAIATVDGVKVDVFGLSAQSWLVGTAHGTDNAGDAIIIANQQGIALLRELRFATFMLKQDVYMYSTYQLQTVSGAFYGRVISGGYSIYIATWDNVKTVFEIEVGAETPTAVLKKY